MNRLPGGPTTADDRAVSDLISYVLTFSILIAAVGIVSTIGFDQLQDLRASEQRDNAERSLLLLEGNLDSIEQSAAVVRSSELDLRRGTIAARFGGNGASTVTVAVNGTGVAETVQLNNLTYQLDDTVLAYESGAVFKADRDDTDVMAAEPDLVCRAETAILSVVRVQGPANGTTMTGGVAEITARHVDSRLLYPKNRTGDDSVSDSDAVTVTIDSAYEDAWDDYFAESDAPWTPLPGPELKYRCDGDGDDEMQVYLRTTTINVSFRR